MSIIDQVLQVSPARTTKADVIAGYRELYKGRGADGWKQHIVRDLASLTGMKPKNLERRFDPSRIGNVPRRASEKQEYETLGQQLPPRVPDGGYHITGVVYVKFSDGECEERDVDETITGSDARALLAMALDQADEVAYQAIVNHYMKEDMDTDEPTASIGSCQEPRLTVSPIE